MTFAIPDPLLDSVVSNAEIMTARRPSHDIDMLCAASTNHMVFPSNNPSSGSASTSLGPPATLDNLDIAFDIVLDDRDEDVQEQQEEQDYDEEEMTNPSPTTILFFEILQDFPDLSSFVCHPEFSSFTRIWLDYKRHVYIAQFPQLRPGVLLWLKTAALQIHFCLVTLVKSNPDRNELAKHMFSAFRRLKDRVEIMHSVINIVENGRKLGQTPLEAVAPLMKQANEINRNVEFFSQEQNLIPIVNQETHLTELKDPSKVSMSDLSRDLVTTYNMMPYHNDVSASDDVAITNTDTVYYNDDDAGNIQAHPLANDNTTIMPATNNLDFSNHLTSFQPDANDDFSAYVSGVCTPVFHVPNHHFNDDNSSNSINRFGFETPLTQSTPLHESGLFAHIEPSWIQSPPPPPQVNWCSLPVTPSYADYYQTQKFLSSPSSPTYAHRDMNDVTDFAEQLAAYNTFDENISPFSPMFGAAANASLTTNALSEEEEEEEGDKAQEWDRDQENYQTPSTIGEDYSHLSDTEDYQIEEDDDDEEEDEEEENEEEEEYDDDDGEWLEPRTIKRQQQQQQHRSSTAPSTPTGRRSRKPGSTTRELRKRVAITGTQKTRRTATSYDAKTTHYLKSIFFDIYSTREKLTKEQRRKVQQETGLKPRNITYWFSNHKRRFQHSLNIFKKTVQETQGKVQTYDDFLIYRRMKGLPEEVQECEFLDDKSINF